MIDMESLEPAPEMNLPAPQEPAEDPSPVSDTSNAAPAAESASAPGAAQQEAAAIDISGWQIISVKARVDSFNQDDLIQEMSSLAKQGCSLIALDLKANRFLSFKVLKHCVTVAADLHEGGGRFALIGCSEKTKRHFEIYGSLNHIQIARSERELVSGGQNGRHKRPGPYASA